MRVARAQVVDFWGKLWLGAGNATADAVRAALAHVRQQPYWDRSNGADHFMVFSYDRGAHGHLPLLRPVALKLQCDLACAAPSINAFMCRFTPMALAEPPCTSPNVCAAAAGRCEMAASLTAEELGSSFAIQSYGDLAARRAAGL